MIVGCGEWGFRELEIEEHFRIARRLGFEWMEFGIGGGQIGRLPEWRNSSQITEYLDLCARYGIKTPFCCIENDFTRIQPDGPAAHDEMVVETLRQIALARKLGATHVRLFAGFTPLDQMNEEIWSAMLDAIRQCDELCQRIGLNMAIETHGTINHTADGLAVHRPTVTTDRQALTRLLEQMPPAVCFNYDPGNIKAAHPEDSTLCLDLLNDRINYCHLKDWAPVRGDQDTLKGWRAVAIGDGDLDYADLLKKMSYSGVYLIEYEPTADVEAGIIRSLDYLNRVAGDVQFV